MSTPDETLYEENPPPSGGGAPNIGELLLHAVARFPFTILFLTGIGGIVALAYGLAQPNQYRSTGFLLLRLGAREQQTAESVVADDFEVGGTSIATGDELLILQSPELHVRVLEAVGAERILKAYDPSAGDGPNTPRHTRWQHDLQAWLMSLGSTSGELGDESPTELMKRAALKQLAGAASISAQGRSSHIAVSYLAHDPELARDIASAFMVVCQQRHHEFYATSNVQQLISEQLETEEAAKEETLTALQELRDANDFHDLVALQMSLSEGVQALAERIEQDKILRESLGGELVIIDEELAEVEPERSDLADVESVDPPKFRTQSMVSRDYEDLLARYRARSGELADMARELDPDGDLYKRESARLREILDELHAEIEETEIELAAGGGPVTTLSSGGSQLDFRSSLLLQRVEIRKQQKGLEVSIGERGKLLKGQQARLVELVALETTYARLVQDIDAAEQSMTYLNSQLAKQKTLDTIGSNESLANLSVTQEALLPTKKEGPQRAKFLAMGILGGLSMGMALALARQLLDSRLRYPKSIESALGIRVLGVVPEERRWRRNGRRLRKALLK